MRASPLSLAQLRSVRKLGGGIAGAIVGQLMDIVGLYRSRLGNPVRSSKMVENLYIWGNSIRMGDHYRADADVQAGGIRTMTA